MNRTRSLLAIVAAVTGFACGPASAFQPDCYDAEVSARITRQTPTVVGGCGDDCIIMAWPWIIDLNVRWVYSGSIPRGPVAVLALQHTYSSQPRNGRRWWLRRNSLGTYNVVQPNPGEPLERCLADAPPARPFISPADGQTLDDLRREGEQEYGADPYD